MIETKIIPVIWINPKKNLTKKIDLDLDKSYSKVLVIGIIVGTKNINLNLDIKINHKGKFTKSSTILRGVFFDSSIFSNKGLVVIKKGAKNADSFYSSKILLFDQAKGESVPSLEIDENELKAGHASTIGKPDLEHLFYLQSRGINKKESIRLITAGFFEPVINNLNIKEQDSVRKKINLFFKTHNL